MPMNRHSLRTAAFLFLSLTACGDGPTGPERGALSYTATAAGIYHTCGLTTAGSVYCWGSGDEGQIGTFELDDCGESVDGSRCSLRPRRVETDIPMTQLSAGGTHNCAIAAGGAAYCWGSHDRGQLGAATGITTCSSGFVERCSEQPVRVLAPSLASISAGSSHTCAIDAAGAAYCWGYGASGRLGTLRTEDEAVPVNVETDVRFRAIAAGGASTCGISLEGAAYCWGFNHLGQLGDGTTLPRAQPTRVITDEVFETITVGSARACALTPQGAAFCWGSNGHGGLGTGEALAECRSYGCDLTPRPVKGGHVFSAIDAGSAFVCGVTGKGVLCWGDDDGQTGTGLSSPVITEPTVVRGTTLRSVDAGFSHACGLRGDGAAYCWGSNWFGSLGNGDNGGRSGVPVPVVAP